LDAELLGAGLPVARLSTLGAPDVLPEILSIAVQLTVVQLYLPGQSHSYPEAFSGLKSQPLGRLQDRLFTKAHSFAASFLTSLVQSPGAPLCPSVQQRSVCSSWQIPSTSTASNPSGQSAPASSLSQPAGGVQSKHSSPAKKLEHSFVVSLTIVSVGRGAARQIPADISKSATSAVKSLMSGGNGRISF